MTDQQHPITPPPELVEQLRKEAPIGGVARERHLIAAAYRAGADQELEACCEWLKAKEWIHPEFSNELRAARRPKPPSLKEQALAQTNAILNDPNRALLTEVRETLELNRRALERLQELEGQDQLTKGSD